MFDIACSLWDQMDVALNDLGWGCSEWYHMAWTEKVGLRHKVRHKNLI
jgi:hypothetical protein